MERNSYLNQAKAPCIGNFAPQFKAHSTRGEINFPYDFKGSWVLFFSHPADFTPVCTTEFMIFAAMEKKFAEINTQLVGLSVDGVHSHIAWLRTIKEKIEFNGYQNIEIRFPVIEDMKKEVAQMYGMIHEHAHADKTVRAVFIIDPSGIVRMFMYYPINIGRSFDEIYRILVAIQASDEFAIATPVDWQPGDDVIVNTTNTTDKADARMINNQMTCKDWFFCTEKLDKGLLFDTIHRRL